MYYNNLYGANGSKLNKELFDVNKQISSGLQIQYAHEDVRVFTETMRLDNELSALGQVKKSTENGTKIVTQTDSILNEFGTTMDRMRVLLIQASNDASSEVSRDAIANELRGIEDHLINLANTSVNGQYLFAGSAVDVKPISSDGVYKGNDVAMNSLLGSGVYQQHNITGQSLFLGAEEGVNRTITTNVRQYNLSEKYPDFSDPKVVGQDIAITTDDTIRDLMGDIDSDAINTNKSHFYINGTKSDGVSFNKHIEMNNYDTVDSLLTQIGNAFGNTSALDVVNVSLNSYGEIVVEDKARGSSKLDFHMVGAIDYDSTDGNDAANIYDDIYNNAVDKRGLIDNLDDGETNFDLIMKGASTAANTNLYVKSFVKSPYEVVTTPSSELKSAQYTMTGSVDAADVYDITINNGDGTTTFYDDRTLAQLEGDLEATGDFSVDVGANSDTLTLNTTAQGVAKGVSINTSLTSSDAGVVINENIVNSVPVLDIDTLLYDRTKFTKDGAILSSQTPQILRGSNEFASPSTKISEVADISKSNDGTLDGTKLVMSGEDIYGSSFDIRINFNSSANGGSTFSYDSNGDGVYDDPAYTIYDMSDTRVAVDADDITYQQLMDVMNMVLTNNIPVSASPTGTATEYDKAVADSASAGITTLSYDGKIQFEDYETTDTKASIALYDSNAGDFDSDASVMTFNTNNALTIRDSKTDFFKTIDEVIKSVENYNIFPDATTDNSRNVGIENAISMMDDLHDHISRSHAFVGAQANALSRSLERTQTLEMSTMTLRSSVIDTDMAEASLHLMQLQLNYEAMLSTVGKVSKLSLVNYL
jgi:flagellar hook-associated protein 3 FlgL